MLVIGQWVQRKSSYSPVLLVGQVVEIITSPPEEEELWVRILFSHHYEEDGSRVEYDEHWEVIHAESHLQKRNGA